VEKCLGSIWGFNSIWYGTVRYLNICSHVYYFSIIMAMIPGQQVKGFIEKPGKSRSKYLTQVFEHAVFRPKSAFCFLQWFTLHARHNGGLRVYGTTRVWRTVTAGSGRTQSASIPWTLPMGPVNLQSPQFVPGRPFFFPLNSACAGIWEIIRARLTESVTSLARFASCSVCPPSSTLIRPKRFVIANHFPCTLARPPPAGETYLPSNLTA
jgi:hypothetical protein